MLDGHLLHVIYRQIDPDPQFHPVSLTNIDEVNLPNARAKNFDFIVRNLKTLYEDELKQTLLTIPDCLVLGHSAGTLITVHFYCDCIWKDQCYFHFNRKFLDSRAGLEQMKLLLSLLLDAAVQCPNKEIFINHIRKLDETIQFTIMQLITQVRETHNLVLSMEVFEKMPVEQIYNHITRIARERDRVSEEAIVRRITIS